MLKIENQKTEAEVLRNGWYLDNEGNPWFFVDGCPTTILFDNGWANAVLYDKDVSEFEPFTRLTGKIVISNEGL